MGEDDPGEWVALEHSFRDGHVERWWALEPTRWPFDAGRQRRLVVATTDPATLPELTTFYLFTNLPAPEPERGAANGDLAPADVAEVTRLYALAKLDRAELQAGEELLGLGSLPGAQGPLDPEALAVGVLRVQLLLVGVRGEYTR